MTIDKFTIKAQETVQQAVNMARQNGQQSIEPVHLLKALMDKAQDITTFIFQKLGVNVQQLNMLASQEMQHLARVQGGEPYLSNDSQKVLQKAEDLAHEMNDEYVSCEPILLAGANEKDMRQAILELRQGQRVQSQSADDNYQSLEKYAKNLVDLARQGKLDPVIGRDDEIRRVLQILSARYG